MELCALQEELAPCYGFLGRVKLLRLPVRCRQSLLGGNCHLWSQDHSDGILTAVSGTLPGLRFPNCNHKLQSHLILPLALLLALAATGEHSHCLQVLKVVLMAMISCLSGGLRLFPGSPQLCHNSPLRVSSQQSTVILIMRSDPQSLSLSPWPLLIAGAGLWAAPRLETAIQQLCLW